MNLLEPMTGMFTQSRWLVLDFSKIPEDIPVDLSIESFFRAYAETGKNPREPRFRQEFNDHVLEQMGARYLIGGYGEDRIALLADTPAGREGRTIHLAIDVFARDQEPIFAPTNGRIVRSAYEYGFGEYGNYIIFQPAHADYYIFFGHLAADRHEESEVKAGEQIARLGDYPDNENGGWSRHLHIQILTELPEAGTTPPGYSTKAAFAQNSRLYPNPLEYFTDWHIQ